MECFSPSASHFHAFFFLSSSVTGVVICAYFRGCWKAFLPSQRKLSMDNYRRSSRPFKKKDDGIRPIAVGEVLRRMVTKVVIKHAMPDIQEVFSTTAIRGWSAMQSLTWSIWHVLPTHYVWMIILLKAFFSSTSATRSTPSAPVSFWTNAELFLWPLLGRNGRCATLERL